MTAEQANQLLARYLDAYRLEGEAYKTYIEVFNKNNFGEQKELAYEKYLVKKANTYSLYKELMVAMTGCTDD